MYEKKFTFEDKQKVPQLSPSHDYQNQVRHDVGKLGFQWSPPLITTVGSSLDSIGIVLNRKWIFLAKCKIKQSLLPTVHYLRGSIAQFH